MKKILVILSFILLLIIIGEGYYLFYIANRKISITNNKDKLSVSEIPVGTLKSTEMGSELDKIVSDDVIFEGKVNAVEEINELEFINKIDVMQSDGNVNTIKFSKNDFEVMSVIKIDSITKKEIPSTFENIRINDNIKIEFFIDQSEQVQTTNNLKIKNIIITIY